MLIISSRNKKRFNRFTPVVGPGGGGTPSDGPLYTPPTGVEWNTLTRRFKGTVFKYGPMAALAGTDDYYWDLAAMFTGTEYIVSSLADWNAINKSTIAEWSIITVTAGVDLGKVQLPKRTGWDVTTGGLVWIRSNNWNHASFPQMSRGIYGAAQRVNLTHRSLMFKMTSSTANADALNFADGAGGWWITGCAMTRLWGTTTDVDTGNILNFFNTGTMDSLSKVSKYCIMDRCCIYHEQGTPKELKRGVALFGQYNGLLGCHIGDFFFDGGDSQGVWIPANSIGNHAIVGNYLSGLSQGILTGGNDPVAAFNTNVPSDVDIRYNYIFANRTGIWTNSNYSGESKATLEWKTAIRHLAAFNRANTRMYSGSYKNAFLVKAADQNGGNNYAAHCKDVIVWANKIDECNNGALAVANITPASTMAKGCERIDMSWNFFGPAGLVGQPGGPPDQNGLFALLTVQNSNYNSNSNGPHQIRVMHNTGEDYYRMIECPTSDPPTPNTFADILINDNVNMRTSMGYGPFYGSGTGGGNTFAIINARFGGQLTAKGNIACHTGGTALFDATFISHGNVNAARDSVIEDYAGGNYRIKTGSIYKNAGQDGIDPGADLDYLATETDHLVPI